jgi:hypothetical protein
MALADFKTALNKDSGKYGAGDVEKYYPKQDVAVEVPLRS